MLRNLIHAFLLSAFFAPGAQADTAEHYTCDNSLFGCYTTYVGPVTPDAAQEYLRDASDTVERVLRDHPGIATVHYILNRGELVIQMREGEALGFSTTRDIGVMFTDRHLYVESVVVMDHPMRLVLRSAHIQAQNGGKSRFFALNGFTVKAKVSGVTPEVLAASRVTRKDVWGNIQIGN